MRVVIDERGVVTYPGNGSTTLEASPAVGMMPNKLAPVTPTSASLYTLTTPGMYYMLGAVAATASLPNPLTVPGSTWLINVSTGTSTLRLSSSNETGTTDSFYGMLSGTVGPQMKSADYLTISRQGSVALMSMGKSYVVFATSGSITIP